jgi:threonine/homoserine/homoserine lactone efflux protein
MIDPARLITYLIAVITLMFTPGPAQTLVVTRSIAGGHKAGILTSFGIIAGTLVHTFAATLGLSTIMAESAIALTVIKYFGAIYLVYLGVKALLVQDYRLSKSRVTLATPTENRRIFTTALTISVLNPQEILFFLAFLPQFVEPSRGFVALQFLLLGFILALLGAIFDFLLISATCTFMRRLIQNAQLAVWRQRISGAVFVGLGVHLVLASQK